MSQNEAETDVRTLAIERWVREGHPRRSAEEIVKRMSYQEALDFAQTCGKKVE